MGGESMKININGVTREMTAEEIAEFGRMAAEMPMPEVTPENRLAILENALLELGAMLGGAV